MQGNNGIIKNEFKRKKVKRLFLKMAKTSQTLSRQTIENSNFET